MLAAVATYMIVIATVSIIALYATVAAKQVYINSTHTLVRSKLLHYLHYNFTKN